MVEKLLILQKFIDTKDFRLQCLSMKKGFVKEYRKRIEGEILNIKGAGEKHANYFC